MELFDVQYVYDHYEEANGLVGKTVFIADGIKELATRVNTNKTCYATTVLNVEDNEYPFKSESGLRYKYAYYDPNYDVKVAWECGRTIQWLDCVGVWHDFDSSTAPQCEKGVKWRVKPAESEHKFEVGDLVHVLSDNIVGMVTAIHKGRLPNEYCVGEAWYEVYELEKFAGDDSPLGCSSIKGEVTAREDDKENE